MGRQIRGLLERLWRRFKKALKRRLLPTYGKFALSSTHLRELPREV